MVIAQGVQALASDGCYYVKIGGTKSLEKRIQDCWAQDQVDREAAVTYSLVRVPSDRMDDAEPLMDS